MWRERRDSKHDNCPPLRLSFLYLVVIKAVITRGWIPAECCGGLSGVADGWVGWYSRY